MGKAVHCARLLHKYLFKTSIINVRHKILYISMYIVFEYCKKYRRYCTEKTPKRAENINVTLAEIDQVTISQTSSIIHRKEGNDLCSLNRWG